MFAYPSQRLQDWLSQQWCIWTGRRVDPKEIDWLMGPYGNVDVIEDRYVDLLASTEGLTIHKNEPGSGLVESTSVWNLPEGDAQRLRPQIAHLYEHTLDYEFEVLVRVAPLLSSLRRPDHETLQQAAATAQPTPEPTGHGARHPQPDLQAGRSRLRRRALHHLVPAPEVEPGSHLLRCLLAL